MPAVRKRFASLFAGCGGFDIGFVENGFKLVAAFDNDPYAVATHRANLGNRALNKDLSHSTGLEALKNVDVLLAGPPCQGFSTVGKRDANDPRNTLLLTAGKIALAVRPKIVIVENVRGVKAGAQRKYWDSLQNGLRAGGYKTAEIVCEGPAVGIAQLRTRIVLIAWSGKFAGELMLPFVQGGTLRDAIEDLKCVENHEIRSLLPGSLVDRISPFIGPGQKLSNVRGGARCIHTWDIPEVFGRTNRFERKVLEALRTLRRRDRRRTFGDADPVRASEIARNLGRPVASNLRSLILKGYVRRVESYYDLTHTFNGKYHRLRWDAPSPTVDTKFGDPRFVLHPEEHRGFTVREAARIQGIPDWFTFLGPENVQFRLVGNAVPPPLSHCLARTVQHLL